jgi:DNA-binding CsgD family transcriptional regulator/tetratricopeptide (TPR) repeat protein
MESSGTVTAAGGVGCECLLERDALLHAITGALAAAERGSGKVVLLAGPAGIGKTSLLTAGRRAAREAGFTGGTAVGSPTEVGLPFGLIGQAMVELGGSDVDDVVELQRLGDPSARLYRIFRWLCNLAGEAPLLLTLDDLHWADPDSLMLVGFLARRLSGIRIVVLGSLRPEPDGASALAGELLGGGHAQVLVVEPLSRNASIALLERAAPGALDRVESEGVWRACAGTPLLLQEAAQTLGGGGSLPATSREFGFGPSLLLQRFAGVDGDALAYVRAASILGVRFPIMLAGALAMLEDVETAPAHARLVRAGLLEDLGGGEASFVHPLFAQALLEATPASERERRHGVAFRLLVERGGAVGVAAEHAVAARFCGDPAAVEVCARAGREALAQGALQAAAAHLQGAVELAEPRVSDELLLEYAVALAARGQLKTVEEVCGRLLAREHLAPAVRARVLAQLARTAMQAGRPAEAERRYEEAALAATGADPATEVATLADAAMSLHFAAPIPWTLTMLSRALALVEADDEPTRRPLELLEAYVSMIGASPSGSELLVREAGRWSHRVHGEDARSEGAVVQALNVFKLIEDFAGTTEVFEREFERAVESGAPLLINTLALGYADTMVRLGRPREALELVQRALALSERSPAPWTDLALAAILAELGRDEDARAHIEALRAFLAAMPSQHYAPASLWLDLLDARRLLAAGEPEQASTRMLDAASTARLTGWREPCVVPWAGVAIEAHLAARRIDRARTAIEDLRALTERLSCRWPRAALELGCARLTAHEGHGADADRRFESALEMHAELPMPIAHAEALLAYGTHLRRSGRPRQAREPIAGAAELCERAGAERVTRLARAELAATGGRRRRRETDASQLTSQEERVVSLAAQGMTNAQIAAAIHLSPKTVGHHLQRVYVKLDIHSRRDLIRRAHPPA